MKEKIREILPLHKLSFHLSKDLYITDYKDMRETFNRSDVEMSKVKPVGINCVSIKNENEIIICFDGFSENALPLEKEGEQNKQCECVLFPESCIDDYWILFVETKYANNLKAAFDNERDYPHCMVNQIISTVKYFRDKKILDKNKRVNAIVSFPNLIEEFNSTLFKGDLSVEDILFEYKIKIRGTNSAEVKSEKRLRI